MIKDLYYYLLLKKSKLFDVEYYLHHNPDVRRADKNPLMHYIKIGWLEGRDPGPHFDNNWYLETYADVKNANINPLVHFLRSGFKEGRLPYKNADLSIFLSEEHGFVIGKHYEKSKKEIINYFSEGEKNFSEKLDNILIVCHEAELTGAPVLGWNIAKNFSEKYNVISLFLKGGEIIKSFSNVSILLIDLNLPNFQLDEQLADQIIKELLKNYKIKFAIVNSIVSRGVLPALARRFIPTINLIHEFAAYIKPQNAFLNAGLWAHQTIYSTSMTYENALSVHPELRENVNTIIPQGKCEIPAIIEDSESDLVEDIELKKILDKREYSPGSIIVLGVGYVQIRKGVDLFLSCASKTIEKNPKRNIHFLWIGDGYKPEEDTNYSAFLHEQICRSGLEGSVSIVRSTRNIDKVYKAVDMLLISSRLDPFPNIAIDAMMHKLPVLCFDKATGIAEILIKNKLEKYCVAPYLDVESMSEKILALSNSEILRENIGSQFQKIASESFQMSDYIDKLEVVGNGLLNRVEQEKKDVRTIIKSGVARMDFYSIATQNPSEAIKHYIRSWASGVGRKKLFPGFHPGIYLERHQEILNGEDPLAHYLRQGKPDGPWKYEVITGMDIPDQVSKEQNIALHIHVYYPELLQEIIRRVNQNQTHPDIFISVPNNDVKEHTIKIAHEYSGDVKKVFIVPNRGRDIGPFITDIGKDLLRDYKIIGHVHTKKTSGFDIEIIDRWRNFLLENLLGGTYKMADIIINRMTMDESIGLVFPDNPGVVGWDKNLPIAKQLAEKLHINPLPKYFNFPVGTMFWARVEAIRPLFKLNLTYEDYPEEPLPCDGTILHAIERLLPFIAMKEGYRNVLTNVKGITR